MDALEKEYKNRFEQYEEEPEDFNWEAIQARIQPEQKPRLAVVWWRYGIAASVLIGLLLSFLFLNKSRENIAVNQSKSADNQAIKSIEKDESEDKVALNEADKKSQEGRGVGNNSNISINIENTDNKIYTENKINIDNSININQIEQFNKNINSENTNYIVQSNININTENTSISNKINNTVNSDISISIVNSNNTINSNNLENLNNSVLLNNSINSNNKESKEAIIEGIAENVVEKLALSVNQSFENKEITLLSIDVPANRIPNYQVLAEENNIDEDRRLVFIPPSEVFVNVSPTLSYYAFNPNRADNINVQFNESQDRLGFAAQAGFTYPIAKKLNLRTAFSYFLGKSKFQYVASAINPTKTVQVLDNYSIKIEDVPNKPQTETKTWQYLELQSDLLFDIKKNQAFTAGFRAGLQSRDLRKAIYYARIGYRLSKPVSNRFAFWAEPSLSFSLNHQASSNNLFLYRTTGLGVNVGVSLLN